MSGSDMKGTWARKGYTFQFTRDTEWEGNAVPTIQYRSPFTKKSDHYQFEQVFLQSFLKDSGGKYILFVTKMRVWNQVHCHWADGTDTKGSEHQIDGRTYPLECHYVHVKEGYKEKADKMATPRVKSYLEEKDGLLAIGIIFEKQVKLIMWSKIFTAWLRFFYNPLKRSEILSQSNDRGDQGTGIKHCGSKKLVSKQSELLNMSSLMVKNSP